VADVFQAISGGWQPSPDTVGAAAREVLGCMTWKGKQCTGQFIDYIANHQDSSSLLTMTIKKTLSNH